MQQMTAITQIYILIVLTRFNIFLLINMSAEENGKKEQKEAKVSKHPASMNNLLMSPKNQTNLEGKTPKSKNEKPNNHLKSSASVTDMSLVALMNKSGSINGGTSILLPPLYNSRLDLTTKSYKGFSYGKSNRKSVCLNKNQMLQEYYGCDSPPAGRYNPEMKYNVVGVPKTTDLRFKEPSSIVKLKQNIPVGYLNNFDTFGKSKNLSRSNLPKADRFVTRTLHEKDLIALPAPASYNLSGAKSIKNNASLNREAKEKLKFSPKKKYDRFFSKAYFKELDNGNGDQSPGPCAYLEKDKTQTNFNHRPENLLGKADRGLNLKKEDKESPSPTKYDVKYDFSGTVSKKGPSFGSAPKKFSLF